jgi:hypothetical protein
MIIICVCVSVCRYICARIIRKYLESINIYAKLLIFFPLFFLNFSPFPLFFSSDLTNIASNDIKAFFSPYFYIFSFEIRDFSTLPQYPRTLPMVFKISRPHNVCTYSFFCLIFFPCLFFIILFHT